MVKFLFIISILATFSVAMGWELELPRQEYHLAKRQQDLSEVCSDLVLQMMDCMSFMTDEKTTKPTPTCCKGLKKVLDTNAECVCFALQHAPSMGVTIIMSRAEALPSLCHVNAPPISSCNMPAPPAPSPATPTPSPVTPAPEPVTPNPPTTPPSSPALPPLPPAPEPVTPNPPTPPNPPSAAPSPATPPSSPANPPSLPANPPSPPATPPSPPASPPPPSSTPSPVAPSVSPLVPVVTPSIEAPAPSTASASGAIHKAYAFRGFFCCGCCFIVLLFLSSL